MRISWLTPHVIRTTRAVIMAQHPDWAVHFLPEFEVPPTPAGFDQAHWPRVAEHVARAERVSQDIRKRGLSAAIARFGRSSHAIEQATLIAAALQVEQLDLELVAGLLACEIDEFVIYGPFLELLQRFDGPERERALACYEDFCSAFVATSSNLPQWNDRVCAVRDGLAGFYVLCGRHDDGHKLFSERYEEDPTSMLVALAASRAFWSAGALNLAISWLGKGAERADILGRPKLATSLRGKQKVLRARLS